MANVFVALFIADDLVEAIAIRGKMRFRRLKLENNRKQKDHIRACESHLSTNFSFKKVLLTPMLKTHASFTCQRKPECLKRKVPFWRMQTKRSKS